MPLILSSKYLVLLKVFLRVLTTMLPKKLMVSSVYWSLPLVLVLFFVLSSKSSAAPIAINPAESIAFMGDEIKPVIEWAAEWGLKVGLGVVGTQLFYTVILQLMKK